MIKELRISNKLHAIASWIVNQNGKVEISTHTHTLIKINNCLLVIWGYFPQSTLVFICQVHKAQVVASFLLVVAGSKRNVYLHIFTDRSSLHINCGDKEATINGIKYEADTTPKGASLLYVTPGSKWAFSSTGNFMDDNINDDNYIATSASKLTIPNSELYTKARLSPLSLTYYGLCMLSGSYTVNLHFAEIVFTNDTTYCSLGKRRFNVFIQVN